MVISTNPVQLLKAISPILVTPSGIVMLVKPVQYWNAPSPIVVILSGMVNEEIKENVQEDVAEENVEEETQQGAYIETEEECVETLANFLTMATPVLIHAPVTSTHFFILFNSVVNSDKVNYECIVYEFSLHLLRI